MTVTIISSPLIWAITLKPFQGYDVFIEDFAPVMDTEIDTIDAIHTIDAIDE
jgi:hypothetical protein